MTSSPLLLAAQIVKTIALQGELKVRMYFSRLPVIKKHSSLTIEHLSNYLVFIQEESFFISAFRHLKDGFAAIRLAQWHPSTASLIYLNNINQVTHLVNQSLFLSRQVFDSLFPPPQVEEDSYYYIDLIGCTVFLEGNSWGKVSSVDDYGGGTLLTLTQGVVVLFNHQFIKSVDIINKIIILHSSAKSFFS